MDDFDDADTYTLHPFIIGLLAYFAATGFLAHLSVAVYMLSRLWS